VFTSLAEARDYILLHRHHIHIRSSVAWDPAWYDEYIATFSRHVRTSRMDIQVAALPAAVAIFHLVVLAQGHLPDGLCVSICEARGQNST